MAILLWRWSTTAQIVSALILAVFFVVLRLSVRRRELGIWVAAWMVNLAALVGVGRFVMGRKSERWEPVR